MRGIVERVTQKCVQILVHHFLIVHLGLNTKSADVNTCFIMFYEINNTCKALTTEYIIQPMRANTFFFIFQILTNSKVQHCKNYLLLITLDP